MSYLVDLSKAMKFIPGPTTFGRHGGAWSEPKIKKGTFVGEFCPKQNTILSPNGTIFLKYDCFEWQNSNGSRGQLAIRVLSRIGSPTQTGWLRCLLLGLVDVCKQNGTQQPIPQMEK